MTQPQTAQRPSEHQLGPVPRATPAARPDNPPGLPNSPNPPNRQVPATRSSDSTGLSGGLSAILAIGSDSTALAALVLPLLAFGCGASENLAPNLVLITVDSLRADRLACYGGPDSVGTAICEVARDGRRYSWAISPSPFTAVAIASLFTSRYPSEHGVAPLSALPSRAVTLAEVLRSGGYRCGAFVGNPSLNHSSHLQQGFDVYRDRPVVQAGPASAARRGRAVRRPAALLTEGALEFANQADEPWFIWIHYGEPGGPYAPLTPGPPEVGWQDTTVRSQALKPLLDHSGRGGIPAYQLVTAKNAKDPAMPHEPPRPGSEDIQSLDMLRRYDAEIRGIDRQIARLVAGLDAIGRPGILITADHGEALGEDDYWFAHGHSVALDQIRVPLVWRPPTAADSAIAQPTPGRTLREPVSTLDIAPTLVAAAQLQLPDDFTGVRLAGGPDLRTNSGGRKIFAEHPLRAAVVAGGVYYARDRRPIAEPVPDRLRGGELHALPTRMVGLQRNGSSLDNPMDLATAKGDTILALEAALVSFLSHTQEEVP